MNLYAQVSTSLEPAEKKTVGPFSDPRTRAQWMYDTVRSDLRALKSELELRGDGITIEWAVPWDSNEVQTAINPKEFINLVRRQYNDLYKVY